jgi:signal transduction histidine kinase
VSGEYKSIKTFRYLFIFVAVIIAIISMWVSNVLVNELKEEERKKIELWAESVALMSSEALAEDSYANAESSNANIFVKYDKFLTKIIEGNTTIPVILTDDSDNVVWEKNILSQKENNPVFIKQKIQAFKKKHAPITIHLDENTIQYVYYDDPTVLKQLLLFPVIQLTVLFIFIAISFLALNSTQKAEQNKVWVGLSKETAHQLGTPISSLMAWTEYLKTKDMDIRLLDEMNKDVQRLKTIAERFSKIGSNPEPEQMDLKTAIQNAIEYMGKRISSKVSISFIQEESIFVLMNESLFGWIIENLIKNAVDAMDGKGNIEIHAYKKGGKVFLDISDTGKGIPKSKFNSVFQPGYTTKKRGWGLGLSLVKRIIESSQKGKIYVFKSELNKGTTFRIELKPFSQLQ